MADDEPDHSAHHEEEQDHPESPGLIALLAQPMLNGQQIFGQPPNVLLTLLVGLILGIAGQLGDLAESLLKRDCQVKDTGCLPGLGGVLDVIDSLLFTAPLFYGILIYG